MLEGKSVAVFDLEIKKTIEQCSRGWASHDEMGISVLCIYDYLTGRYRLFDDNNLREALEILYSREFVVGYNTIAFDWKVLMAQPSPFEVLAQIEDGDNGQLEMGEPTRPIKICQDFDMLIAVRQAQSGFSKGNKLDDIAGETLGQKKSGDGAQAPHLYQQCRYAELYDYCLEDVHIEKSLFEFMLKNEFIIKGGAQLPIQVPNGIKELYNASR